MKSVNFILSNDIPEYIFSKYGMFVSEKQIISLLNTGLVCLFSDGNETLCSLSDVEIVAQLFLAWGDDSDKMFLKDDLFSEGAPKLFRINRSTTVEISRYHDFSKSDFSVALKNLISRSDDFTQEDYPEQRYLPYFQDSIVKTKSKKMEGFVTRQMVRANNCAPVKNQFLHSAHYMGTKKNLCAFLSESISLYCKSSTAIVDLMCGSGGSASSFIKSWNTYASDGMAFCGLLSKVQGGGFTLDRANYILKKVLPVARGYLSQIDSSLEKIADEEEMYFHSNYDEELLDKYNKFITSVPTFPNSGVYKGWNPTKLVKDIRLGKSESKHVLFSSYFANVYFGIKQSIEIDCLRRSFDVLKKEEFEWALGALIATVSSLATTYGGHFAQPQPMIKNGDIASVRHLSQLLEKRARSVIHEFSKRLLDLSEFSAGIGNEISIYKGHWKDSISYWKSVVKEKHVLVYLDAPYKREEYSRYYHVLETLVLYNYPSSHGPGRVPDRKSGELFCSEFFTRSKEKIMETFKSLIGEVIELGWTCAWSYSDNGDVFIPDVVDEICKLYSVEIATYSTLYSHKSHGRRSSKEVNEYLILFIPKID